MSVAILVLALIFMPGSSALAFDNRPPLAPNNVNAAGHDSRIDLRWQFDTDPNLDGYNIYRADSNDGLFTKLNDSANTVSVYSDFFGANGRPYVKSTAKLGGEESKPSNIVSATSNAMTDKQLLTSVQEAVFRYF
jgi:fibronectin type 3 domain-containing protein